MPDDPAGEPAGGKGGKPDPEKPDPEKEPADEQKPPWGSDEDFDPERAWKLIQNLRQEKGFDEADELEDLRKKVKGHEDASKTEQQRLEERATAAEGRAKAATADADRLRVAIKKGLTETQAKRLVGDNEEELEKDADELLESFKRDDEDQGSHRRPRERLRPGAAPASEPDKSDPKSLAADVPRGY